MHRQRIKYLSPLLPDVRVCVCVCRVSERNHLKAEYLLRLVLVLVTFGLAAAIPRLDLFISLVGTGSTWDLSQEELRIK